MIISVIEVFHETVHTNIRDGIALFFFFFENFFEFVEKFTVLGCGEEMSFTANYARRRGSFSSSKIPNP